MQTFLINPSVNPQKAPKYFQGSLDQKRTFAPVRIHKPLPVLNLIESPSPQKVYMCQNLVEYPTVAMISKNPLDPLPKLKSAKKLPVIHSRANSKPMKKSSLPVKLYNEFTMDTFSEKTQGFPQRNLRLGRPLKNAPTDETCSQNINHMLLNLLFLPSAIYYHPTPNGSSSSKFTKTKVNQRQLFI